MVAKWHWCLA